MDLAEYYKYRRGLVNDMVVDLIGPSEENEIIHDRPCNRYISGILYPRKSGNIAPEIDTETSDDDDEGFAADPPVAMANVRYPSSMGLTFAVDSKTARKINISVQTAKYIPITTRTPDENSSKIDDENNGNETILGMVEGEIWQRVPLPNESVEIDIGVPDSKYTELSIEGLRIFTRVRTSDSSGIVPVTVALVNNNELPSDASTSDEMAFFQSRIFITSAEPNGGVFASRLVANVSISDEDLKSYRLLYRHLGEYATGHGCSVDWEVDERNRDRAKTIFTTYSPEYNLLLTDSNPDIKGEVLDIKWLIHTTRDKVIEELYVFCSEYDSWIKSCYTEAEGLRTIEKEVYDTAKTHLYNCEEALERMRAGVGLLARNDESNNEEWAAFKFMNQAMLQQRTRSVWLRRDKPEGGPERINEHHWRPFQLAFILLCLVGISNKESDDRKFLDLLWFPTGGGKTEAYLGLISYTVFLRRLKNTNGAGVTALMRYTMRLLTIQQFERAALLICCCEEIRRNNPMLGEEPVSVGLWLGQGATPNRRKDAAIALSQLATGAKLETKNPVQLHQCPWCGKTLTHKNYAIAKNPDKMIVSCRSDDCEFSESLPVYLIDDDIYDFRPTLIIATVDKFAFLPWSERALEIFNSGDQDDSEQLPPELIIQDELHLISGPLGTLTGLYETAVDALCSRSGSIPKIIASTATIRRARQQAIGLFNREVRQFPPPALDVRNSYFAVEVPEEDKGSRLYIGLIAPGTSHATLLIRCYAALFQGVNDREALNETKDPYWTLVGYFNSLRVLGAANFQIEDDVKAQLVRLSRQSGKDARPVDEHCELTSNEPSSAIPKHLKKMGISYSSDGPRALDYILATNMISVGVDIDRLGLMAVMGQPQSTSEYIQSTSRVGRQFPG